MLHDKQNDGGANRVGELLPHTTFVPDGKRRLSRLFDIQQDRRHLHHVCPPKPNTFESQRFSSRRRLDETIVYACEAKK